MVQGRRGKYAGAGLLLDSLEVVVLVCSVVWDLDPKPVVFDRADGELRRRGGKKDWSAELRGSNERSVEGVLTISVASTLVPISRQRSLTPLTMTSSG